MSRSIRSPRRLLLTTRLAFSTAALAASVLVAVPAQAQSAAEKAEAQALFNEGRKLMEEGKLDEACKAFEGSHKADPAIGTLLNLANCFEKAGKTASAWAVFEEVATKARRANQPEREKIARQRADALASVLSKLTVNVEDPPEGLAITVNGSALSSTLWNKAAPTDPGEQKVVAEAPGKKSWTGTVTLGGEADAQSIEIPKLEDAPEEPKADPKAAPSAATPAGGGDDGTGLAMEISGWTMLGVGVAAGAAGAVLRVLALGKNSESFDHCSPEDPEGICTQEGQDLRDEAQALQTGSLIAWIAGGALAVGGVVLVVTAPSDEDSSEASTSPRMEWVARGGPGYGALDMRLRW